MGQSKPPRATALIVEDDVMQREMTCLLLEESDFNVIECESAEAAELVLERNGGSRPWETRLSKSTDSRLNDCSGKPSVSLCWG